MGHNGRGRPPQPARESSGGGARLRSRVAWLLRVGRLYGAEPAWVSAASFSAAFPGGSHPEAVSQSRISRWETGRIEVPGRVIRRYEELLGLPACTLTATVDLVTRYLSPGRAAPARRRPDVEPGDRLESFVDQACSSAPMSAAAWEDGVALVMAEPGLRLRRRDWDSICNRLLVETVAADGDAWKPRFEAFSRLLQHPHAQPSAAAACAGWARCRDNQVFIETVSLLDACRHPDAAVAIVGQLTNPTNDFAFAGALLACIRKVPEGHFSPPQLATVGDAAAQVLTDTTPGQAELRSHAATVLASLPPGQAAAAVMARHPAPPAGGRGLAGPAPAGSSLGSLIAARSVSLLPREIARFTDHVLPVLVDEILHAPVADTRMYSAFLIRASPYAQPAADALGWGLSRLRPERSPQQVARLLEALRILGGGTQRALAERLTGPSLPFEVREAAFRALGHMGGVSAPSFWPRVFAEHSQRARTRGGSDRLLGHAVYAIAMERDFPRLRRIAADPDLPGPVRAAAAWWLSLPGHMLASAEH
jgi:hypothetical protein